MITSHILCHHSISSIPILKPRNSCYASATTNTSNDFNNKHNSLSNTFISLALSISLTTPLPSLAIPLPYSKPNSLPQTTTTTPFSQAKNMPTGLDNGKIRACPSINPGCVSTNPKSSNFTFPLTILGGSTPESVAIKQLEDAITKTQKNVKVQAVEDVPDGKFLQVEVDGGFGKDVMEFLVKGDMVLYRTMATKVTYIYPFTTAFGDSKGQEERMKLIIDELGWFSPSFDSMDMVD